MKSKKYPKYYYPAPDEEWWNSEVEKLLPWVYGDCLDVGAGGRSISPKFLRLDADPEWEPDILEDATDTKQKDESFDFISAIHIFEHIADQDKALIEWLRILRPGGYIGIVHPDIEFTGKQKEEDLNEQLAKHPLYKHEKEQTYEDFMKWIKPRRKYGFEIIKHGIALGHWSFYVILRKNRG